jgi:hypothetical protein
MEISSFTFGAAQAIAEQLVSAVGPAAPMGLALARASTLGLSDTAVSRGGMYQLNRLAVADPANASGYANTIPDPGVLTQLCHQVPIGADLLGNGDTFSIGIARYHDHFASHGYDVAVPGAGQTPLQNLWGRIIHLSASPAPLEDAVRAYQRTRGAAEQDADRARDELAFFLERGGYSRQGDRRLIVQPWYAWSLDDAVRLGWMGAVTAVEQAGIIAAAGCVREVDVGYQLLLSQQYPAPDELIQWANRRLWDEDLAQRYDLDAELDRSPLASFFAAAQGVGSAQVALPNQPQGMADWLKLRYRDGRLLPDFGLAAQLQYRLRDDGNGNGQSVVAGIATWSPGNTRDMLKIAGYPEPVIDQMMGIITQPLNVRIINTVLLQSLKHRDVAALAQELHGEGVDWVKNAYLDHGFSDEISSVAAAAVRAHARDEAEAERIELEKTIRAEQRAAVLDSYEIGTTTAANAVTELQGEFVTAAMAQDLVDGIEAKIQRSFASTVIASVKEAFFGGKVNIVQVGGQLKAIGVSDQRLAQYVQEWTWQLGDRQRTLSTTEILQALKAGLLTPAVALLRLENLGWTAPDAMVEIGLVQHELAQAEAAAASRATAKEISAAAKAKAEAKALAAAQAKEAAATAKAAAKAAAAAKAGPLTESIAAGKYDAAALLDLDAYNKANAKNDTVKMQAEVDKAALAYRELLLSQLKLSEEGPNEAKDVKPVAVIPVPTPSASTPASATPAEPAQQPSTAPGESGGAAPPATPG